MDIHEAKQQHRSTLAPRHMHRNVDEPCTSCQSHTPSQAHGSSSKSLPLSHHPSKVLHVTASANASANGTVHGLSAQCATHPKLSGTRWR